MAHTNILYNSYQNCSDLHNNLGFLNTNISSTYNMESNNNNSACMILQNAENCPNFLSTGYLEDALIEFGVRFKRRKLMTHHEDYQFIDPLSTQLNDDLGYWSNWLTNYNMYSEVEELSRANLLANNNNHMHYYSSGESMEESMKGMCDEVFNFPETNTLLLDEIVDPGFSNKILEMSSNNSEENSFKSKSPKGPIYSSDTYSTDSSYISGGVEMKKKRMNTTSRSTTKSKMVYPFGLVKPGGEEGDITLKDVNIRISKPPTRPLKHPVGAFASRPAVLPNGPGLSGKAVVAFTKIHTQGRGTITIIRTKG